MLVAFWGILASLNPKIDPNLASSRTFGEQMYQTLRISLERVGSEGGSDAGSEEHLIHSRDGGFHDDEADRDSTSIQHLGPY